MTLPNCPCPKSRMNISWDLGYSHSYQKWSEHYQNYNLSIGFKSIHVHFAGRKSFITLLPISRTRGLLIMSRFCRYICYNFPPSLEVSCMFYKYMYILHLCQQCVQLLHHLFPDARWTRIDFNSVLNSHSALCLFESCWNLCSHTADTSLHI